MQKAEMGSMVNSLLLQMSHDHAGGNIILKNQSQLHLQEVKGNMQGLSF